MLVELVAYHRARGEYDHALRYAYREVDWGRGEKKPTGRSWNCLPSRKT